MLKWARVDTIDRNTVKVVDCLRIAREVGNRGAVSFKKRDVVSPADEGRHPRFFSAALCSGDDS
jgi:hypothetical protein